MNSDCCDHVHNNILSTELLHIAVVSMLSLKDFEQLELACCVAHMSCHFGGIQIVASGDLNHLPPVHNSLSGYGEVLLPVPYLDICFAPPYPFGDAELAKIGNETAHGHVSPETHALLQSRA